MCGYSSLCKQSSCTFPLWTLILCSAFVLITPVQGQSHLVCPSQVVAMMDDDVVLPCQLKPAVDTNSETVTWIKPGLDPNVVHLHKDGRLVFENQNPSYHLRTRVFVDELIKGNVSLKILRVKLSDEGTYRCSIPSIREEASIQLIVASVSTLVIKVMSDVSSSRVVFQCESAGWYPEPELLWLDGEGKLLSAGPTETLRGPDDLYTVSSRVTVEKRHSNNITCRVQQRNTNQSRETHIHVADNFTSDTIPTVHSIILTVVAVCFLSLLFVLVQWKFRPKKTDHRNDGREQTEEEDIRLWMSETLMSTKGLLDNEKKQLSVRQSKKMRK